MQVISAAEARELLAKKPERSKYNAQRVKADGYTFDSKAEHARYEDLKLLQRAKRISGLEVHPDYVLSVNGVDLGRVIFDFEYMTPQARVIEDVKNDATNTRLSRWKRAHFEAQFGLKVVLV